MEAFVAQGSRVIVYRALDTTFAFEAPRALDAVLRSAYVDLVDTDLDSAPAHVIRVDRSPLSGWRTAVDGIGRARRLDASGAMLDVRRAVNDLAEESALDTDAVLNASAIDIGGTVVAIVGPVVAGKSSLLLTAARRGHGYVADDVVAIRSDRTVRPFHRPVGVRLEVAPQLDVEVPEGPFRDGYPLAMGARHRLSPGGPLGMVVLARRADGLASETHSASWGLMMLVNSALRTRGRERLMFRRLAALLEQVPVRNVWFDEPGPAVDLIERALG